jgi:WD40 repeat protein
VLRTTFASVVLFLVPGSLLSQQACPPIQVRTPDPSKLLFTPQQEMDLGDAAAEEFQREFRVIDDEDLTAYLRRVGEKVVKKLPESNLHFAFYLYDLPEVQAFGAPGGRIYVSRKLVAFVRNDDELANLLGHELGHLVARQQALEMSHLFRDLLGVKQVGDRKDIFEKYNQMLELIRVKRPKSEGDSEQGQLVADQIGVQAAARAGYSPQAFADFFDRLAQTKGKTGNWLSNFFRATPPNSRRLREILKDVSSLPAGCIEARAPGNPDELKAWQADVLHYKGLGHKEKLHGVLSRRTLSDPLRGDIDYFRFSPDGKYILAQGEGGIDVLTRQPFAYRFRIDAPDAHSAQFTPDSRQIVFYNSGLRVETWDVEQQEQVFLNDLTVLRGCRQTALSPDGKVLACFGSALDLSLYDTATGESFYKKERFYDPASGASSINQWIKVILLYSGAPVLHMEFSPDARYFLASSPDEDRLGFDLSQHAEVKIRGALPKFLKESFVFLDSERVVGIDPGSPEKSAIVRFPSGEILDQVPLGRATLAPSSNPRYVLVRPTQKNPVGAYDLVTKKIVVSNRMSAYDVWGDFTVAERLNGEIGLYPIGELHPKEILQMPLGRLGGLRASAISPDLKWLAISSRTRGGLWNLQSNSRAFLSRGFQSSAFPDDTTLYLDLPQFENSRRELWLLNLATEKGDSRFLGKTEGAGRAQTAEDPTNEALFGSVILRSTHHQRGKDNLRDIEFEAIDTRSESRLWSRSFPKLAPRIYGVPATGRLVLLWPADSGDAREEIRANPQLRERFAATKINTGDFLLEVVDSRAGTTLGGALVLTGKGFFRVKRTFCAGQWIVVEDDLNRVLVYSLATGEQIGKVFGATPVASSTGNLLTVTNETGELLLYDLPGLTKRDDLFFTRRFVAGGFSGDGRRLFILTDDQTAFVFDVSGAAGAAVPAQP